MRVATAVLLLLSASLATAQSTPPGTYVVTQIATNASASAINNYGQVVGSSGDKAYLWTPATANATVGSLIDLGGLPVDGPPQTFARGINNRGEVVGVTAIKGTSSSRGFLWSPDTPNAASGTMNVFAGAVDTNAPFGAIAINSYGQVIGAGGGGTYLWTPSVPNGTTGTINPDPRLYGVQAINDFGQAVIYFQAPLFTPFVANGSTGTFSSISGLGLSGAGADITAINNSGTILGQSCVGGPDCNWIGFLWTPDSPHGAVGTSTAIPLLPGYVGDPAAGLNASGQAVGRQSKADGTTTPFLYTGATTYDLGTLGSQLQGGAATAINDLGQIVINADNSVYLLTPITPSAPAPGEYPVTIASNVAGRAFTVFGNGCRPGGYTTPQTLGWVPGSVCNVTFISPQSSQVGTRYWFDTWQDGARFNPRNFTAPSQQATYTGNFTTQYFVTTLASLPDAGTVSGGGWYYAGETATLTATPVNGFRVVDWSGTPSSSPGVATITMVVTSPVTATANFAPSTPGPPARYVVTQIAANALAPTSYDGSPAGRSINNLGQVVGEDWSTSPPSAFLWTPTSANQAVGSLIDLLENSAATGINDRGQVVGGRTVGTGAGAYIQAFLWSPAIPNGTTGAVAAFLGSAGSVAPDSYAWGINSFGQIIGFINSTSSPYLWTPSSPNASTGTTYMDPSFRFPAGINDFGQIVMEFSSTLFTPSVPNGATGTYTPISGIGNSLAINNGGTLMGASGGLWTPSSPNGTVGTASQIPLPAGYLRMQTTALNARGDVVGFLSLANGAVTPFLYTGGAIYDLSALSSQLRGGTPAGINDRGQIVINAGGLAPGYRGGSTYLLTPTTLRPPAPASVTPAFGNGFNQTMTFSFTDPDGWQNLDVVNILINNFLDSRNACYLAYSRPLNVVYLVNDAGTALLPGVTPGGAGTASNSQCSVNAAGASVTGSGNVLTLTLNLGFAPGFAGNKITWLAARDTAQNNSGWQPMGVWQVPGAAVTSPSVVGVTPARATGYNQLFTFTFADGVPSGPGWQDLGVVNVLINEVLTGSQACYLAYSRPLNVLYLVNDQGTGLLAGSPANNQCSVSSFTASGSGTTLTLILYVTFSSSFAGNRIIYLAARDTAEANNSGWQASGTWLVP